MALLLVLAVVQQIAGAQADSLKGLEIRAVDSLRTAELQFFDDWRRVFRASEVARNGDKNQLMEKGTREVRLALLHCHPEDRGAYLLPEGSAARIIRSRDGAYAICPSWLVDDNAPYNRRETMDDALTPSLSNAARADRARLIARFERASRDFPGNDWIRGQLVRLLIDQRALGQAVDVARGCRGDEATCAQFVGFALAAAGHTESADSAFERGRGLMTIQQRCANDDIGVLLDDETRAHYSRLSCAERDSLNAVIWWLADPLWSTSFNERRVAHFARATGLGLSEALVHDELQDWRRGLGGDAIREVVLRYGWPAYRFWGGAPVDMNHSTYLFHARTGTFDGRPPPDEMNAPYTTFEYSTEAIRTVPAWAALSRPFDTKPDDWKLRATPTPPRSIVGAPKDVSIEAASVAARQDLWWPREHYVSNKLITQASQYQIAFFRRDTSILTGVAAAMHQSTDVVSAHLIASTERTVNHLVATRTELRSAAVALNGFVRPQPTLFALEIEDAGRFTRARFPASPPAALSSLPADSNAISDIALLRPPVQGEEYPAQAEAVLEHMLGAAAIRRGSKIGIYWEGYGFSANDSVAVAVWIERFTPQGIARRFGIALDVVRDLNTPIAISWIEQGGRANRQLGSRSMLFSRALTLDTEALPAGEYWIDVVMRAPSGNPVRGRRMLKIE